MARGMAGAMADVSAFFAWLKAIGRPWLELGHITEEEAAAIRQACGWVVQRRLGI